MDSPAILHNLLEALWAHYTSRVEYARQYQSMVEARGGKVQNDHIAFRTINAKTGQQPAGVEAIARIFTALGYKQIERYIFTDKKLTSWHYEHATNPDNPKIFISQLEVDKLSPATGDLIRKAVAEIRDPLSPDDLSLLAELKAGKAIDDAKGKILVDHLTAFFSRPWKPPQRAAIEHINKESQYAAWTLLHGNSVNHFTAYINHQGVKEWPDLEATVNALRAAGLPMKSEFEGERGSRLRQSSTQAWDEDCDVLEADGTPGTIHWSYAYYELAERGMVAGPNGTPVLFHGFLGEQATNLFDMTKRS